MPQSNIIFLGEEGAQRGVLTDTLSRAEFDRWALDWALGSMELSTFLQQTLENYSRAQLLAALTTAPEEQRWQLPVGEGDYPSQMWYAATVHDLTGTKPQPLGSPRKHTGIDLNLDFAERGDVERRLGLSVYAVAAGVVSYVTGDWNGAGMVVIRHEGAEGPEWWRYAHIIPSVAVGDEVRAGDKLGPFANWKSGDHLHLDGADEEITRQWLTAGISWFDPVERLKQCIAPAAVDAMLAKD